MKLLDRLNEVAEGAKAIDTVCFHHNDSDGHAAAAVVVRKYGKNIGLVEMDYDKAEDYDFSDVPKDATVIIVDFSFKPEKMAELQKITQNITWIDHHKTMFDAPYNTKDMPGIRSDEGSGCYLAWIHFFPDLDIPKAIALVSDYDTWTNKIPDSMAFAEACRTIESPKSELWEKMLDNDESSVLGMIEKGKIILEYREAFCVGYSKDYGFECTFEGKKCFALNIYAWGSEAFGQRMNDYDICISFVFNGSQYQIGLYSAKDIDVGEIAKKHGGGGHKGAAGFIVDDLPFKPEKKE